MADGKENSCFECEYFTKAIGEKGYCKFYHHELTLPERACPKYKEKKTAPQKADAPETVDPLSRRILNLLMIGAFLASTVFTVFALVAVLIFVFTIIPLQSIPKSFTFFVSATALIAVFLFTYILFTLGKKYVAARVVEMILALIITIIFLVNLDEASIFIHEIILRIVDILVALFI